MNILVIETRDNKTVEFVHGLIAETNVAAVKVGDHLLSVATSGGMTKVVLSESQWEEFVGFVVKTLERKH